MKYFSLSFICLASTSLFAASLNRIETGVETVEEIIEVFDYNLSIHTGNDVTQTIKVEYQLIQPKINILAGHTGYITGAGAVQTTGIALTYPEKFIHGIRCQYFHSYNESKKTFRASFDYFNKETQTIDYEKKADSSIYFNGVNSEEYDHTEFISGQTKFGYQQFTASLDTSSFSLQLFNSSYGLYTGIEFQSIKLLHSKTGKDAPGNTYGYEGYQQSIGCGPVTSFEYKKLLYRTNDATVYFHSTFSFGYNYTIIDGTYRSINIPPAGANSQNHLTALPEKVMVQSSLKRASITYQKNPTKEKPTSFLIAIGAGKKDLSKIDQIECINNGIPSDIEQQFFFCKIGYSM